MRACVVVYNGHYGDISSICVDKTQQVYIASGDKKSKDRIACQLHIWNAHTGVCVCVCVCVGVCVY